MRISTALLLGLAASAAVIGCSSTTPSDVQQARLTAAIARWASNGRPDYELQLAWSCGECPPESSHLLRITVQDGQVTEAFDVTANQTIAPNARTLTVVELYAYIQQALDDRVYLLSTEYDETLGYPISVSVDRDANAVDDEGGFQVISLQLTPSALSPRRASSQPPVVERPGRLTSGSDE